MFYIKLQFQKNQMFASFFGKIAAVGDPESDRRFIPESQNRDMLKSPSPGVISLQSD